MKSILILLALMLSFLVHAGSDNTNKITNKQSKVGGGGSFYLITGDSYLKHHLNQCENYKLAGNHKIFKTCRNTVLNAHDYLIKMANYGPLTVTDWTMCPNYFDTDLSLSAKCLVAVGLLCSVDEEKNVKNYPACMSLINSGAWITNPSIQRMDFSKPDR